MPSLLRTKIYGNPAATVRLFEDNSTNYNFEKGQYSWLTLAWKNKTATREGNYNRQLHKIVDWDKVAE